MMPPEIHSRREPLSVTARRDGWDCSVLRPGASCSDTFDHWFPCRGDRFLQEFNNSEILRTFQNGSLHRTADGDDEQILVRVVESLDQRVSVVEIQVYQHH